MSLSIKPGELHDAKGVPIYPGDLIRTPHFNERRGSKVRKHYLYHVVIENQGTLEMVPARELYKPGDGGRCWLTESVASEGTVIDGCGPENWMSHWDRPRQKGTLA